MHINHEADLLPANQKERLSDDNAIKTYLTFVGDANSICPSGSMGAGGIDTIQQLRQKIMSGASPSQFKDAMDAVNKQVGNRAFLQFVQSLSSQNINMDNHAIAAAGLTDDGRPLTHRDTVQQAFGHHDVGQMREYTGPLAQISTAALGAHAYSSNGRVAFADIPDMYTQAHEAAHAVQQTALRSGLQLKGGIGAEGDKYEQHADMVADAVVQGKSAEALLDQIAGGPTTVVPGMAGTTGPVQMITEKEHKQNVRKDQINKGTFAQRKQQGLLSRSGRHELLELTYEDSHAQKLHELNEQFEIFLAHELEKHATTVARQMARFIGGFQSFDEAKSFIEKNLESRLEHTEVDVHSRRRTNRKRLPYVLNLTEERRQRNNYDYSEKNLYPSVTKFFSDRGFDLVPNEYVYGWSDDIEAVNLKLEWLKQFKNHVEHVNPTEKNRAIRKHVRKVYNSVKLNHMLLSQMGYFGGSMEFRAGIEKDLEYWVYLISTKTRVPKNSLLYPAPKQMLPYKTSKEESRLPYLNQFSISIGHAEFSKAKHIPDRERKRLEEAFEKFQDEKGDDAVRQLNELVGAPGHRGYWDLSNLLGLIDLYPDGEDRRKTLYTNPLRWSWSRKEYDDVQHENPFYGPVEDLNWLHPSDITDPRLHDEAATSGHSFKETLANSPTRAHVVGRSANILLTPESATWAFRKKLKRLDTVEKFNRVYGEYVGEFGNDRSGISRAKSSLLQSWKHELEEKRELVLYDAVEKVRDWYENARATHKPIYAGPSGHTLGYLNLYAHAYDQDELAIALGTEPRMLEKPTLEEARAVMLASLIGKKEHHSYDEVMTAAHGIKTEFDRDNEKNKLKYGYPGNYGDVFHTDVDWIQEAAERARITVVNRYKDREEYVPVLYQWALNLFSNADEMQKWVSTPAYLETDEEQQYSDKRKMMKDVVFSSGLWVVTLVFIIWQALTHFKDSLGSSMNMTNSSWDPLNETSLSLNTNLTNSTDIPQLQGLSPLFWVPIMLAFSTLCADVYLLKREMRTASAYAIRTIGRLGPQVSSKIMSAALGLGLTYTVLNFKDPSESPEDTLAPERAFASALFREFVLFTLNNAVVVALPNMLSYCVSVLASKCGKGSMESKTLQYDDNHIRKVLLLHTSRSILISLLTSALQAGGQLSSNPYDSEVIVANLMLHLITELLVDRITISHEWAEKMYNEDARQTMLAISSKALGHPSFSKKPSQYTHFGRDPKLHSSDEKLIWTLTSSADLWLLLKAIIAVLSFTIWAATYRKVGPEKARAVTVLANLIIAIFLSYKRIRDTGTDNANKLPVLIRGYRWLWSCLPAAITRLQTRTYSEHEPDLERGEEQGTEVSELPRTTDVLVSIIEQAPELVHDDDFGSYKNPDISFDDLLEKVSQMALAPTTTSQTDIEEVSKTTDVKKKASTMSSANSRLDEMLTSSLQLVQFKKWITGTAMPQLGKHDALSPENHIEHMSGGLSSEERRQNFRNSLAENGVERGIAHGDRLQCFLDTVYQWAIGGRDEHIRPDVESVLRHALNLPGEGMVEFNLSPGGILEKIAARLNAVIHVNGINTNTGELNPYGSVGSGNHHYHLLHYGQHFEPLWPAYVQIETPLY